MRLGSQLHTCRLRNCTVSGHVCTTILRSHQPSAPPPGSSVATPLITPVASPVSFNTFYYYALRTATPSCSFGMVDVWSRDRHHCWPLQSLMLYVTSKQASHNTMARPVCLSPWHKHTLAYSTHNDPHIACIGSCIISVTQLACSNAHTTSTPRILPFPYPVCTCLTPLAAMLGIPAPCSSWE